MENRLTSRRPFHVILLPQLCVAKQAHTVTDLQLNINSIQITGCFTAVSTLRCIVLLLFKTMHLSRYPRRPHIASRCRHCWTSGVTRYQTCGSLGSVRRSPITHSSRGIATRWSSHECSAPYLHSDSKTEHSLP